MRDILRATNRTRNKTVHEILHVRNVTQNKQCARYYTLQKEHRTYSARDTARSKHNKKQTVREIIHVTNTTQNIQCVKYYTYQIEHRTYSVRDNTRNK